jgi:dipeptidase D
MATCSPSIPPRARSPFELDRTSEPGKLLGRGTEDDKGPIATALYAMKAIQDKQVPLSKRIELYVYMAEESDWEPLKQFLKTHTPPQVNITIDAEYPVVTAEKGYGSIKLTLPPRTALPASGGPVLQRLTGGFFGSQIPEDARPSSNAHRQRWKRPSAPVRRRNRACATAMRATATP